MARKKRTRPPSHDHRRQRALSDAGGQAVAEGIDAKRRRTWVWALLLGGLTFLAYAPTIRYDFVAWDDTQHVRDAAQYNPPTLAKVAHFWTKPYPDMYTPMLWTMWGLLVPVARQETPGGAVEWNAVPFHAFNVIAHAAAAAMAFLVLRRVVGSDRAALLGAAVFALHPMQVEAVAWVSGMKTPLSGFFALWAAWHYLRFTELRQPPAGAAAAIAPQSARRRAWVHYGVATFAFLLAMVTKPTVVVMPLIIAALELLVRGRRVRDVALTLMPWVVAGLLLGLFNVAAQPAPTIFRPAAWQRALLALNSLSFYLWKLLVPYPLLPDYSRTPQAVVHGRGLWVGAVPAALLIVIALARWRKSPWLAAAVAIFCLGGVTTLGLITYDYQRFSTVADRYAYLSLLAPALVVAYLLRDGHAVGRAVAASCVVGACVVLTVLQCRHWRDTATLFSHTLAHNSRSLAAYRALAHDADTRKQPDEVVDYSRRGLQHHPNEWALLLPFATGSRQLGRYEDAIAGFRALLKWDIPRRHESVLMLGQCLALTNREAEAEAEFREAIRLKPDYADAYENLGALTAVRGDWPAAVEYFAKAVSLNPTPGAKAMLAHATAKRDGAAAAAAAAATSPTTNPNGPGR